MVNSDTSIVIHLVKNIDEEKLDDVVKIKKNFADNDFELTYKDGGEELCHKAYYLSRDHVADYVYLLLKNQYMDEDGYESIQISVPAMPRILVSASKMSDISYREHFLELVEYSLGMLDRVEKLSIEKPKKTCRTATGYPDLPSSPVHRYFS